MFIALDYDGTYNKMPKVWDKFIAEAKAEGHEVAIVTMRFDHEQLEIEPDLEVYFTCRQNKHDFMQARGKFVHIWIDDMPWFIHNNAVA